MAVCSGRPRHHRRHARSILRRRARWRRERVQDMQHDQAVTSTSSASICLSPLCLIPSVYPHLPPPSLPKNENELTNKTKTDRARPAHRARVHIRRRRPDRQHCPRALFIIVITLHLHTTNLNASCPLNMQSASCSAASGSTPHSRTTSRSCTSSSQRVHPPPPCARPPVSLTLSRTRRRPREHADPQRCGDGDSHGQGEIIGVRECVVRASRRSHCLKRWRRAV